MFVVVAPSHATAVRRLEGITVGVTSLRMSTCRYVGESMATDDQAEAWLSEDEHVVATAAPGDACYYGGYTDEAIATPAGPQSFEVSDWDHLME